MTSHTTLTCTETRLVLSVPLEQLPTPERQALTAWLVAHHVTPDQVAVGYAIERDPYRASLAWRVHSPRGVERHTVYPPCATGTWPAPFPHQLVA
jgi:hypothetical protein